MNKYGKFNEKGNEYIITDYLTPRPQMNYVWNERMLSGINHFGGGVGAYGNRAASYIDEKGRGRANIIKDGDRYFYIRDMKTGAYWNPGWYPSKTDIEEYSCTHGIGYTKISAKKDGIKAAITGFVGTKLPAEQWKIELENTDNSEREIKVYSFVEFSLEGYATYSEYDSYVSAWNNGNMIYAQNTAQERPHDWYNGFIASSEDITGFETSKNAFLGLYGSIFTPKTVADGKCTNSLAACERMVGVLENTFTLKPNEKKTFYVAIGSADSETTAKEMSEELLKDGVFETELLSVQKMKAELQNRVMIKTPIEKINALTNYWVKNQVQLCAEAGRATGKGFRDQLQDAWGIAAFDSGMARVKILEVLAHQYSDGRCVRGWLPLDPHIYSDGPVWIAPAVNAYLKETGDFKFLDEPVKYLDDVDATVWEHLVCAAEYSANDLGVHGLVLAHDGDWNDSLNGIGMGGKGESVWTSIALCIALKETAEIAREIKNDTELSDKLLKYRETMIKNINENAWDGEWYLAAYNDKGEKVGSHECKEGKIYLNSQTWAIIAGVCDEERKKKCIESVNKYLKCDYGFMTLYPAYTEYDKNVGRLTGFVPGIWENGTPYCHGGAFKLVADTVAGRAEDAVNSYLLIAPDSEKNPSAYSGCEPYVFTNMYFGPDNIRKGQTSFAWVTGTAGWMFRVITQNILGFMPEYDGFKVNPCIPSDWDYAEETRKFRGDTYIIKIHNDNNENKITLDGIPIVTDIIPHIGDGKEHIVEIHKNTHYKNDDTRTIIIEKDEYGGTYCRVKMSEKKSRFEIPTEEIANFDAFCCSYRNEPFFMDATAGNAIDEIPKETQWLGVRHRNGEYSVYFSMVYGLFRTAFQGKNNWLTITAITGDSSTCGNEFYAYYKITGHDFYELVRRAARSVSVKMGTVLKENKDEPEFIKDFGWCTWDSFYFDVTGNDIIKGLENFRDGGFVPKLLILDDGWQTIKENREKRGQWKLSDFCANEKFEGGLSDTIHKAKERFGIREFFVWHAVMGYWGGVDPDAPKMQKYRPRLSIAEHPQEIKEVNPARWESEHFPFGIVDKDKFYDFYNDYHEYLKSEGVDGVKIDVQASVEAHGENQGGRNIMVRAMRSGLEKSVMKNFNGNLINCMSCSNNIIYNVGATNVMRTSDDFSPSNDASHSRHIYRNAVNSIWMRMFIICDWDMFQTSHKFAWYHAAARAISGGPIYVSDKVGEHNFELIKSLTKDDGEIIRTEETAVPTVDCLFANPTDSGMPYKVFSKNKHNGIVGIFSFGKEGEITTKAEDVAGIPANKYAVYCFKTGKTYCLNRMEELTVHLGECEFEIITFAPIYDDFAVIGMKDKLNCGGTVEEVGRTNCGFEIKVNTGGQLAVYCKGAIEAVHVNGEKTDFERNDDFLMIEVGKNGGDVLINMMRDVTER